MRKGRLFLPLSVLAILVGLWGGTQLAAIASGGGEANAVTKAKVRPAATVTEHAAPKKVYLESEPSATELPASTFTQVGDTVNAKCPGTTGSCSLEVSQNAQFCFGTEGAYFYVRVKVDGAILDQAPYSGMFGPEQCDTRQWTYEATGLTHGSHTVQFYAWCSHSAYVIDYTHAVRVYKP